MEEMRHEPPIAVCAYGWGQEFRLYQNYLAVSGTNYPLSDLTHIHPVYQQVLGISSVRLELRFGKRKVTLRGIAALEEAQKVIEYLTSHYLGFAQAEPSQGSAGTGKGWSKSRASQKSQESLERLDSRENQPNRGQASQETPVPAIQPMQSLFQEEQAEQPPETQDFCLQTFAQAPTAKIATPNWQRFRQEQRERRQRRLHVERSLREHGFDVDQLAQRLKEEILPEVTVPLRLLAGERAHYKTDATLCGEPVSGAIRYTYPAKEHGTLILTNKRLLYIGRRSQIVLDYGRLLHVSRLRGAIAFQAEHWYKREIFEVPRSLECTMFLERILERFQHEQQLQAIADRQSGRGRRNTYVQFQQNIEEAPVAVDIDTMPLSRQQWDMAEVIDSMNG